MCGDKPWISITETKSAVYMMNSIGPNTDPCGTPHISAKIVDLASPCRTYCDRPSRYDWSLEPLECDILDTERHLQALCHICAMTPSQQARVLKRSRLLTTRRSPRSCTLKATVYRLALNTVQWRHQVTVLILGAIECFYLLTCLHFKINKGQSNLAKGDIARMHMNFYPRDAMLARVIEIATCLSVRLSVRHAPVLCQNEES